MGTGWFYVGKRAVAWVMGIFLMASALQAAPNTSRIQAQCTTSFGRALDESDSHASVSFEPKIQYLPSSDWAFKIYSLIDRPTDPYKDFSIPSLDFSTEYTRSLGTDLKGGFFTQASLVDLLRWSVNGWVARAAMGPEISWQATSFLRVETTVAPYLQFSEYRLRADGQAYSAFGIAEQLKAVVEWGKLSLEASLFFVQSRKTRWRNEYLTYQQLAYAATPHITVGFTHQLSDEVVALSTGLARPFGLFDGRLSRVSGFMRWKI